MAKKKGKKIIGKIAAKIKKSKVVETTSMDEAAKLTGEGYKIVEVRSEKKGDYKQKTIPKTYVLKK